MRIQCIVSYDGTSFDGWQKQPDCRSVQEVIETAINKITGENNIIHSSGRTDAKVHASNQVFHFDTQKDIAPKQWQRAINHFLPEDVYIKQSQQVSDDFHSRYSAMKKEYHYRLSTNPYNPFERHYIYQYPYGTLDLKSMQEASKIFIGTHDFASFCVYDQLGTTVRTISSLEIIEENGYFTFKIVGDGFRRYMVRMIVGGLIQVGAHRRSKDFLLELLESRGTKKCLFKAEPQGLYLEHVYYE